MESLLEFLEMIAEVYVTAFVAGPIAIIIMVVAQNISGQNTIGNLMPLMYIGLPLGALVLIFILYVLLPPNNLVISKKEIRDSEYSSEIIRVQGLAKDPEFEKKINRRKRMLKINDILHHPVKAYISSYIPAGILGGVFVVVVILLWYFGIIEKGFPYYTIEVTICFVLMVAVLPLAVAYEIRNRYVKSVEKQLPEVLREISDMRDVGMTLQGAINMISGHKRGVLSTEIRMVSEEVKYGASLSSALVRMEERVGLTTVKRAISLLVRASEVTDYIREILAIAIADLEHYLKMKNKRCNVSFVYLAIIYLSVGIFLFAAYEMNVAFINSFSSFNMAINTGNSAEQMFIIGIILAFFSGIMAGQLSANTILSGLKHSIVMLAMTIVTFVILVGVR
ncbi:MAG TPA: type II secretion system F family protein [Methanocorpusculum sp.]|nr:type II secretion system F family protein [Methanocorpusculum sp.]